AVADIGRPTLRLGGTHPAVRELQRKLNRIHSDLEALALPGLDGCPLRETDRFDAQTARAVTAFQQQVFDDPAKWDGVVAPDTWAPLDLLPGRAAATAAAGQPASASRPRRGGFLGFSEVEDRSSLDYVRWIQTSLNSLDSAGLVVDGINGPKTHAAIRSF